MFGRNVRLTLVGIDLASMEKELYYRVENLHPRDIELLLRRVDASRRAPELLAALEECMQRRIRHELPGYVWGFSYALHAHRPITFSLFSFARTLIGVDRGVREMVLSLGAHHGWELTAYEHMSRPLEKYRGSLCHHGVLGFVLYPDMPVAPWVGLAPPESRLQ
jgi:hypothetical protein